MVCELYSVNKKMFVTTMLVTFIIVIGYIEREHHIERGLADRKSKVIGIGISLLGYTLLTFIVSIDQTTHKMNKEYFLKRGLPTILVFIITILSINLGTKSLRTNLMGLFSETVSLIFLASMLTFSTEKYRKERLWLYYGGISLIVSSKIALSMNRRYNTLTGRWDGPENVFGMGLPMLATGWFCISLGLSLC